MIRFGAALAGALLLSACWADDRDGTVTVRPSADAPGGFRLASTLATPTYPKFADLTGDRSFVSSCAKQILNTMPPTYGAATLPDQGLAFAYTDATQVWAVTGDGLGLSFGPANVDTSLPSGFQAWAKPGIGSFTDRLRYQTVGIVGIGPFEYMRTAQVITNASGASTTYNCIIGVPTEVSDVPATSLVTYQAVYGGSGYRTITGGATSPFPLGRSTVALQADLLTGTVTTTIHFIGTPASGPDVDLGTVTGTAAIDPLTGAYYGTSWSSADMTGVTGQFSGRFYGPQGKETAFVLTLAANSAAASPAYTLRTAATVIGTQ